MNKLSFFIELKQQLTNLSKEDLEDILRDYEEYFQIGINEGKTEAEIISKLGSPKQIAQEILSNYSFEKMDKAPSASNKTVSVWAVIGVCLFNLIFILGPFLGILSALLAMWIVAFSFILSPLISLFALTLHSFFQSILLCGIGILLGIGLYYVTNWVKIGVIKYVKFNLSIVKGGN